MNIRFISSLTSDDEDRLAPAVLMALAALLDETTITYALRIETSGHKVFQHDHPVTALPARPAAAPSAVAG